MENSVLPLVTIGIPTFNGNRKLFKPLESIWAENYPNIEIIISDNCSTDNTQVIVEEIRKNHRDLKYFRQSTNIGQMPNYCFLMKAAKGKYFMWVADDDSLEPGSLLKMVQFMEKNNDYSLASGKIQYWHDDIPSVVEGGFTFEQDSPRRRVAGFYSKVIYGGLMHGLMRTELAKDLTIHNIIGNDYHFLANLVYLGKVKNFEFTGYNKNFGGTSKNFKHYARQMGESWIVGHFPHLKIARDAFQEVFHRSRVFSAIPVLPRLTLAVTSFCAVLFCYYGRIFIGARLRNHVVTPIKSMLRKAEAKA